MDVTSFFVSFTKFSLKSGVVDWLFLEQILACAELRGFVHVTLAGLGEERFCDESQEKEKVSIQWCFGWVIKIKPRFCVGKHREVSTDVIKESRK